MYFLVAVLFLWAATAGLSAEDVFPLPVLVQWVIWTLALYGCGVLALEEKFAELHSRLGGVLGFTMILLYYTTQSAVYMTFLPTDFSNPTLWPTVFLSVNLLGPIMLAIAGCVRATVQGR